MHFWPHNCITHSLIHAHRHRQQNSFMANKIPLSSYSPTHVSCLCLWTTTGTSGPKACALIMLSDRVFPHPESCRVIPYQTQSQIIRAQLQELQNGFIMCLRSLMRVVMKKVVCSLMVTSQCQHTGLSVNTLHFNGQPQSDRHRLVTVHM